MGFEAYQIGFTSVLQWLVFLLLVWTIFRPAIHRIIRKDQDIAPNLWLIRLADTYGPVIKTAYAPLLIAIVMAGLFTFSAQMREVLVSLAETLKADMATAVANDNQATTFLFLTPAAWSMYAVPLVGLMLSFNVTWLLTDQDNKDLNDEACRHIAILAHLLPVFGVLAGLLLTAFGDLGEGHRQQLLLMIIYPALIYLVAFLIILIPLPSKYKIWNVLANDDYTQDPSIQFLRASPYVLAIFFPITVLWLLLSMRSAFGELLENNGSLIRLISILTVLPLTGAILLAPVLLPLRLGPMGVLLLAIVTFGSGLSILSKVGQRTQLPIIGLLLLWGITLSFFDWNDNHLVAQNSASTATMPRNPDEAFARWASSREDANGNLDGPVYLIAAQGGGLYAAHHAAITLARIYDTAPAAAERIFAISSVSGGAVGAAIFEIVRKSGHCAEEKLNKANRNRCYTDAVRDILEEDFLSPVTGRLLFADLMARFVPNTYGLMEWASRARTLRETFEMKIRKVLGDTDEVRQATNEHLFEMWSGSAQSKGQAVGPLMLFNATDVNTGARVILTNLRDFHSDGDIHQQPARTLSRILKCQQVSANCPSPTALDAALVSARFPLITPAARFHRQDGSKIRLVDGGYFENSGTETLLDLRDALNGQKGTKFEIIVLDFEPDTDETVKRDHGLGGVLSPIRAMLAARTARGELPKRRSKARKEENWEHRNIRLDKLTDDFTLGWYLSERASSEIACHIWDDEECRTLGIVLTETMQANRTTLGHLANDITASK